jgi:hypothetical protein
MFHEKTYRPNNYVENCILYIGTHYCNTVVDGLRKKCGDKPKLKLEDILREK